MKVSLFHKIFGVFREQFLSIQVLSIPIRDDRKACIEHVYFQKAEYTIFPL